MELILFGMLLPWLLVGFGCWLAYQLMRQNGRILLRLEQLEELLKAPPPVSANNHGPKVGSRDLSRSKIRRDGLRPGTPAPDFTLPQVDGGDLSLSRFRGRKLLLVFSDPRCGPCDALLPELERRHRESSDLAVLLIGRGEAAENRQKVRQHRLTFPVALQKQWEVSRRYAMFATPIAYLVDEQGRIARDVAVGVEPILEMARDAAPVADAKQEAGREEVVPLLR